MNDIFVNCMKQESCTLANNHKKSCIISHDVSITTDTTTVNHIAVDYDLINSWYKSLWDLCCNKEMESAILRLNNIFLIASPIDREKNVYSIEIAAPKIVGSYEKGDTIGVTTVDMINLINFGNNLLTAAKYVTIKTYE